MIFNDDEPIAAIQDVSGEKLEAFEAGKTEITIISKPEATLEESEFKVMLEFTGVESENERFGVDLVTVLDVSGSMEGEKLEKIKIAMQFVINKLSPIDRLSIVTFAADSRRLCPLRQMTENSQVEIEDLVNTLVPSGGTDITAGLQTGLKVLSDRRLTDGRVAAIMLLSDCQQNNDGDILQFPVDNVPVYTFGIGANQDPKVLKTIAENSKGGTFSYVHDHDNLRLAFSQCLAELLTVVVQDLKLTVTQIESTIEKVSVGNHPQSRDVVGGSVTVSLGDLYEKEVRKVMVDLLLPAVSRQACVDVLVINYAYSTGGKQFDGVPPVTVTVNRIGTSTEREREEVIIGEKSLQTVQMIDEKQGRPSVLSFETSHDRQRFAARGDVDKVRLFATPRMNAYLEEAKSFDKDPSKPPPMVGDDVKHEFATDSLAPVVGDPSNDL